MEIESTGLRLSANPTGFEGRGRHQPGTRFHRRANAWRAGAGVRMPSDRDAVLDKVEKLLALASSSNVHEAALAAERARALVVAHRLEAALAARQAQGASVRALQVQVLERARRPRAWRGVLAHAIAEAHCCLVFRATVGREEELRLVGADDDRAAVALLFGWLAPRVEWLSATHGAGRDRCWHEAFRVGVVDAIAARLGVPEAPPDDATAALVLAADEDARRSAVEAWAGQHLGPGRGRVLRVDARAAQAGRRAGAGIALPGAGTVSRR